LDRGFGEAREKNVKDKMRTDRMTLMVGKRSLNYVRSRYDGMPYNRLFFEFTINKSTKIGVKQRKKIGKCYAIQKAKIMRMVFLKLPNSHNIIQNH